MNRGIGILPGKGAMIQYYVPHQSNWSEVYFPATVARMNEVRLTVATAVINDCISIDAIQFIAR